MEINDNTVNAIRDLANAEATTERLDCLDKIPVLCPPGYTLVDTERFEDTPALYRAQFATHLFKEFANYINTHALLTATSVFVDVLESTATAILDMGDGDEPLWGKHRAKLALKKTPEFDALTKTACKTLSQQDLIDFIEDWAECLVFYSDDSTEIPLNKAIAAIRDLTVSTQSDNTSKVEDYQSTYSATDMLEIKSRGDTPPVRLVFSCAPFDGFQDFHVSCRLRAVSDGKSVSLKYRIIGFDALLNDIAMLFKAMLEEAITAEDTRFYCGTIRYQE
jgi:uncharacterized protein YfdQ (DUF2303 family)